MFIRATLSTVGFVLWATAALASDPLTATLSAPVDKTKEVIAGSAVWHCEGTSCITRSDPGPAMSVSACRELVRKVGAVSTYGSAAQPFDADRLGRCNPAK